ncbi:cullin-4b [Anaeramoeba ignava]|uniref:Cullin-4b n=1 Tax=Anaeramoeba ignava TaxID=1746090 RepID=A0A9Q0LB12_ANAIG|nr:cullin-4b [Anaeramoeba ignava]
MKTDYLYNQIYQLCEKQKEKDYIELFKLSIDKIQFIQVINNKWKNHCVQIKAISNILLYLDRVYLSKKNSEIKSLWDMGLFLFSKFIIQKQDVNQKIISGLLILINNHRIGENINLELIKDTSQMLSILGKYHDYFEKPFLIQSQIFYQEEQNQLFSNFEISHFLHHVENRLQEEKNMAINQLNKSTLPSLIKIVEDSLLKNNLLKIVNLGFRNLCEKDKFQDLKLLYQLFQRVNGDDLVLQNFESFITYKGLNILNNQSNTQQETQIIEDFILLKEYCDRLIKFCFSQSPIFNQSLDHTFEMILKSDHNKIARLLSKFIHLHFTLKQNQISEDQLEKILDKTILFLKYIQSKDIFEAFYKNDLANRLLMNTMNFDSLEKQFLLKLKMNLGSSFSKQFEIMFQDVEHSKELNNKLKNELKENQKPNFDLNFYMSHHHGRKLLWQNSLGRCIICANFIHGKKNLDVSLLQAIVILCFNQSSSLTFFQIQNLTQIEISILKKIIGTLITKKYPILKLNQNSNSNLNNNFSENDVFSFNEKFNHKKFLIKIPQNFSIKNEEKIENDKIEKKVWENRQYQIDSYIVRIMKSRKTINHNELIKEIQEQIKSPIEIIDINKRINSLIEREYLERDPNNKNIYNYLA